jgi:small-conductance mechanosensitive channel
MKAVLIVIILIAACVAAGYFGLPILVERETSGLKSEVNNLKQRLLKIEEYIKKEEEARKAGQLPSDADVQKIVKTVNAIFSKVTSLEETLKSQAETINKSNKENQSKIQGMMFDAAMASIRGHLLKVQIELKAKNIGTAKTEIDLINEIFEKTKSSASEEQRKAIEELQGALKKAKDEMEINLPAAINRVDLLWHEMGKLIRKG